MTEWLHPHQGELSRWTSPERCAAVLAGLQQLCACLRMRRQLTNAFVHPMPPSASDEWDFIMTVHRMRIASCCTVQAASLADQSFRE